MKQNNVIPGPKQRARELRKTLWNIAALGISTCSCGAPEWNDTGRCRQCWERDEEEIDCYYHMCDQ